MKKFAIFIATGFGAGFLPKAPGTAGSLLAFAITLLLSETGISLQIFHSASIVFFGVLGLWATQLLEKEWGKDPQKIVVDEMVGIWISYLFIPPNFVNFFVGFLLFRLFDITKILGIKKMEKLPGAWGVMADDVLAGIYANIVLQCWVYFV